MQWTLLLRGIEAGDDVAREALHGQLTPIRGFFEAQLPDEERDERFQDLLRAVVRAIRAGGIRDRQSLSAYAWSTAQRILRMRSGVQAPRSAAGTGGSPASAGGADPAVESLAVRQENREVALRVLGALPEKQRELLIRYYLKGEPRETIQEEMGLTQTQFRLVKSRAKAPLAARLQTRVDPPAKFGQAGKNSRE